MPKMAHCGPRKVPNTALNKHQISDHLPYSFSLFLSPQKRSPRAPQGPKNRSKIGLGAQGPPKGCLRLAPGSPRRLQGAILNGFSVHFGALLGSPGVYVGFIGRPRGFILERCPRTVGRPQALRHFATSQPHFQITGGRRHGGEAL